MTCFSTSPWADSSVQVQPALLNLGLVGGKVSTLNLWQTVHKWAVLFSVLAFSPLSWLRAGQTEQQGPRVRRGSGKCACLEVAAEREIFSFTSQETGEHRNCCESSTVWLFGHSLIAAKPVPGCKSSQGKPGVVPSACSLLWQHLRATVQSPLVQGIDYEQDWDERQQLLRDWLKFGIFLKFYGKNQIRS